LKTGPGITIRIVSSGKALKGCGTGPGLGKRITADPSVVKPVLVDEFGLNPFSSHRKSATTDPTATEMSTVVNSQRRINLILA